MSEELDENIRFTLLRALPLLSSLLFLLISYIPIEFLLTSSLRPQVAFICIFFWLLHRPDIFNLGSVFLLGLLEDVVSGAPLGSNILAALLLYVLVTNLSKFFNAKPFVVTWYGFALLSFAALIVQWFAVSIYYAHFLPFMTLFFSMLFTIALYPILSFLNAFIQNVFLDEL